MLFKHAQRERTGTLTAGCASDRLLHTLRMEFKPWLAVMTSRPVTEAASQRLEKQILINHLWQTQVRESEIEENDSFIADNWAETRVMLS